MRCTIILLVQRVAGLILPFAHIAHYKRVLDTRMVPAHERTFFPSVALVVAYVPFIAIGGGMLLPHKPGELPSSEDGSPPKCSLCYDALCAPKPGIYLWRRMRCYVAGPLWELPCGHVLHEWCAAHWFATKQVCPTCKVLVPRRRRAAQVGSHQSSAEQNAQPPLVPSEPAAAG